MQSIPVFCNFFLVEHIDLISFLKQREALDEQWHEGKQAWKRVNDKLFSDQFNILVWDVSYPV